MHIDVFCLFPESIQPYFESSMLRRIQEHELATIEVHNIRDYTSDKHRTTDNEPYGGGGGMVMRPEPIFAAVESVLGDDQPETRIVLLTPQGRRFTQSAALDLSGEPRLALICGHYEGVDERVRQHLATDELSIGDYVLTGGEAAAIVVVDAVARLLPGALGDPGASAQDSHVEGLLEGPHYTRPPEFRGWEVPEVLLSGDHERIRRWRREQALKRTLERRPDLLDSAELSAEDEEFIASTRGD